MGYILAGLLANLGLTSLRFLRFEPPVRRTDPRYLALLIGALLSDLLATYGLHLLIRQPPSQIRSYSLTITLLSLLAAAALIFKFAFLREGPPRRQKLFGWGAAIVVTIALYLLFGSIAYFAKVIQDTNIISLHYVFIPAVMLIILWVNTAYDSWDFADRRNQFRARPHDAGEIRSE